MPTNKEFHLTWKRSNGNLKHPEDWRNSRERPKWKDYIHVYRLISISLLYFAPGEYVDPLTQKPFEKGVVDIIEREKVATHNWNPRQRLEVRRKVWMQSQPGDHWSPVNKYNTLVKNGTIIQEFNYGFIGNDRSIWYPEWWSFLLAHPLLIYGRLQNDLDKLWRCSLSKQSLTNQIDWKYPGFEGQEPPNSLNITGHILKF